MYLTILNQRLPARRHFLLCLRPNNPEKVLRLTPLDTATDLLSWYLNIHHVRFARIRHDTFSTCSAYLDYVAVASPLQASQAITSASSSQPDGQTVVTLLHPYTQPYNARQHSIQFTCRVYFGYAGSDTGVIVLSTLLCTIIPSRHVTSPSKPSRFPKPDCNKVVQTRERAQVPHDAQNFPIRGRGCTASPPRREGSRHKW